MIAFKNTVTGHTVFEAQNQIEEELLEKIWFTCDSAMFDDGQLIPRTDDDFVIIISSLKVNGISI